MDGRIIIRSTEVSPSGNYATDYASAFMNVLCSKFNTLFGKSRTVSSIASGYYQWKYFSLFEYDNTDSNSIYIGTLASSSQRGYRFQFGILVNRKTTSDITKTFDIINTFDIVDLKNPSTSIDNIFRDGTSGNKVPCCITFYSVPNGYSIGGLVQKSTIPNIEDVLNYGVPSEQIYFLKCIKDSGSYGTGIIHLGGKNGSGSTYLFRGGLFIPKGDGTYAETSVIPYQIDGNQSQLNDYLNVCKITSDGTMDVYVGIVDTNTTYGVSQIADFYDITSHTDATHPLVDVFNKNGITYKTTLAAVTTTTLKYVMIFKSLS